MQVTKKNVEPKFQPFELTIKVETREEFEVLNNLSKYSNTVTDALFDYEVISDNIQKIILKQLLDNIQAAMKSN